MSSMEIAPLVVVEDQPLADQLRDRLVQVSVHRALGLVGRATLRFIEAGFDLVALPHFALGTAVTVKAPSGTELLSGSVTGVSLDQDQYDAVPTTELTVTVDDDAHKLGSETRNRSFLQQKLSDVMTTIAGEAGLGADVTQTSEVHPYLLQAGTDLAYLDWAASRSGMVWYVDGGRLKVVKAGTSSNTVAVELGKELLRFSARASGRHTGKVTVTGWDDAQQAQVKHVASTTTANESDLVATYPGRAQPTGAGIAVADVGAKTADEAAMVSQALLAESTSAAVTASGTCFVNGAIVPTTKVQVTNAGPSSGSYLVTRVEHVYNASGFLTHFTAGPIRPDGLVDLLGTAAPAPGPELNALVPAVVTNLADPDGIGRAKVKFTTMDGNIESWWARIVTLGGGERRGLVFQPEVGDEVIVGFEQGDTRRPVILGGVFSPNKGLPTSDNVADGKVAYRRITSRLGHLIELSDGTSPDTKHILLKVAGVEHSIRVGVDRLDIKVDNVPLSITNGQAKVEFSDTGDITIDGNNVTIKARTAVKVEAGTEVGVKGNASATIEGATVDVKANATATVNGGGALALKGGTVAIN